MGVIPSKQRYYRRLFLLFNSDIRKHEDGRTTETCGSLGSIANSGDGEFIPSKQLYYRRLFLLFNSDIRWHEDGRTTETCGSLGSIANSGDGGFFHLSNVTIVGYFSYLILT
jgi:hypothetical protein